MTNKKFIKWVFIYSLTICLVETSIGYCENNRINPLKINPLVDSIVKFEKVRVIQLADSFLTIKPIAYKLKIRS